MTAQPKSYVRLCPQCGSARPVQEITCENLQDGAHCHWPLVAEEIVEEGGTRSAPATPETSDPAARHCTNGHPLQAGDELCLVCGAYPAEGACEAVSAGNAPENPTVEAPVAPVIIDGWLLESRIDPHRPDDPGERFLVRHETSGRSAVLTLYRPGAEPDPAVHGVLRRMHLDHVPELILTGRHDGRAFEVTEAVTGGTLRDVGYPGARDPEMLRRIVDELSRALAGFADVGLRHRDLQPETISVRALDPLDLVVTGFGSARLSDLDLEAVAPLELTRYSAPEAIVGAVSAASDWWSLGMIVLEQVTAGVCFEGVNDQAFRLHVVTRGVTVPEELDADVRLLLRGLLARDPLRRWSAAEVRAWLAGEPVDVPDEFQELPEANGPALALAGREYRRPEQLALAAAEAQNWEAGAQLTLRGALSSWLDERGSDTQLVAQVRRLTSDEGLNDDQRHALALMAINPSLPLSIRGDIVTPAWLLSDPNAGYELVTGEVTRHLERMGREPWLVRMRARAEAVRERAKLLEIELDEERVRVALLASSRANLEAERTALRRLYPDTDHAGLASLLERSRLSDEDLIILVSAALHQFQPLAAIVRGAVELGERTGVAFDASGSADLLAHPRREIFALVDERTANFARCGILRVDEWADAFRVERRMPLARAIVLLGVPTERWAEPPRQQYVSTLLEHFEKRVSGTVGRGPLARFTIGKTTPRVDLFELGTGARPSEGLLNHVLSRTDVPTALDPEAYMGNESLDGRLRRLVSHALTFKRDTGLDGRTLGFPFLLIRETRQAAAGMARPRLIPVLLWPVALDLQMATGVRSATLMFDREREEVRLNPALEGLLGSQIQQRWKAARDELLARSAFKAADVVDVFGALAPPRGRTLTALPGKDSKAAPGAFELLPSAALFNAEFTGQSVAEDLRQMRRMPPAGTGLEAALRIAPEPPHLAPLTKFPERERFLMVESDPSQDAAVQRARSAPGLLVEGPPGTGKSQTIVNIVADAIGRGETVLVVCQKQAALRVVQKRLSAEGLADRLFLVADVNRDREMVIRSLREQLDKVRATPPSRVASVRRAREEKAARIELLEAEIDRNHEAVHAVDDATGLNYRSLTGELIGLETGEAIVDAPGLRPLFASADRSEVSRVEEACAPLARLWLDASYEGSPLAVLRQFTVDAALSEVFNRDMQTFVSAEVARSEVLDTLIASFDVDDVTPYAAWIEAHGSRFETLSADTRRYLALWFELFDGPDAAGHEVLTRLEQARQTLAAMIPGHHDDALFEPFARMNAADLRARFEDAAAICAPVSLLGRLNPVRLLRRRRTAAFLSGLGEETTEARVARLRDALGLEIQMRPVRRSVDQAREVLGLSISVQQTLTSLRRDVDILIAMLRPVADAATAVLSCPRRDDAVAMARTGTAEAFRDFKSGFDAAFARHAARARSQVALSALSGWFTEDWIATNEARIAHGERTTASLQGVVEALRTLEAYQRFRVRATMLEPLALQVFAVLRGREAQLQPVAPADLEGVVRRTIRREALLSWKGRIEVTHPELLFEREEIDRKIAVLAEVDREMRSLNKELLRLDVDPAHLGTAAAWEDITRLRGPRTRRLREILDLGKDLGLMRLRPIWLMNPDVASRILPLQAGFFDLVIYDEASQMPVEYAVPTLFRSGRVVISGDEKQMPPTSFFSGRIDGDEEEEFDVDMLEDGATEAERTAHEESWNRREVKDCPDLLQLGRGVLPSTTLQIHYRSKYRELIGYSNAAFYKNELSVPARHPEAEIRRVRPLEVVRVEGVYEAQTNAAEAEKVVDLLADIWSSPPDRCPSIGVVTFNRKQADLVEEAIERRAFVDEAFQVAYQRERDRVQGGEDMGFFVKNVENVQGDERDIIIFSTTFGRDKNGTFRRNFGVLGQTGGERRLNVAVTRARDKVMLVTSMPVNDVSDWLASGRAPNKPRDYLQAYLNYAARLHSGDLALARSSSARLSSQIATATRDVTGDGFVRSVESFVRELGFEPVPADDGDAFGLDFAVADPRTGLFGIGIECDAPRHELLAQARPREIWRPSVLARAIPKVHRVSCHAWYHRGDEERARLAGALRAALDQRNAA